MPDSVRANYGGGSDWPHLSLQKVGAGTGTNPVTDIFLDAAYPRIVVGGSGRARAARPSLPTHGYWELLPRSRRRWRTPAPTSRCRPGPRGSRWLADPDLRVRHGAARNGGLRTRAEQLPIAEAPLTDPVPGGRDRAARADAPARRQPLPRRERQTGAGSGQGRRDRTRPRRLADGRPATLGTCSRCSRRSFRSPTAPGSGRSTTSAAHGRRPGPRARLRPRPRPAGRGDALGERAGPACHSPATTSSRRSSSRTRSPTRTTARRSGSPANVAPATTAESKAEVLRGAATRRLRSSSSRSNASLTYVPSADPSGRRRPPGTCA